jgi:hypothetical protein
MNIPHHFGAKISSVLLFIGLRRIPLAFEILSSRPHLFFSSQKKKVLGFDRFDTEMPRSTTSDAHSVQQTSDYALGAS